MLPLELHELLWFSRDLCLTLNHDRQKDSQKDSHTHKKIQDSRKLMKFWDFLSLHLNLALTPLPLLLCSLQILFFL